MSMVMAAKRKKKEKEVKVENLAEAADNPVAEGAPETLDGGSGAADSGSST
jgi:hypothetical protein